MGRSTLDFRRVSPERLEVQITGSLDEVLALDWERELRTQLRHSQSENLGVLVSLEQMADYSLAAREVLVRAQTFLNGKASGTAYVADTAERRALALWVRHHAQGPSVAIYATRELAERYLDGAHAAISALRPCTPGVPDEEGESNATG